MGFSVSFLLKKLWRKKAEIVLVGLDNAGKTTLIKLLSDDKFPVQTLPTLGFNLHVMYKNNLKLHFWDLQGQESFRSQWVRYLNAADVILFLVDAADSTRFEESFKELLTLLEKVPSSAALMILVNKIDLPDSVPAENVIKNLARKIQVDEKARNEMDRIGNFHNMSISLKEKSNWEQFVKWLYEELDKRK